MTKRKTLSLDDFKRWGAEGGKTKGKSKIRGDSEYYSNIAKKRKKTAKST